MTISIADNSPRKNYTVGNGVTQSAFTVTFEFFNSTDLSVYIDGTLKQLTSDYTVTGGNGSTGTVTFVNAITGDADGTAVTITRAVTLERTTDFPQSGAFQIGALNTELDKFIAIAADLNDGINRSLKLNDTDPDATLSLPDLTSRKGNTLAFDATTGDVIAGPSITQVNTVISNVAQASQDAADAQQAKNDAVTAKNDAVTAKNDAQTALASANLPSSFAGNAGKIIQVNAGETAYEYATSATNNGVFYGLKVDTTTGHLVVDYSELGVNATFQLSNYDNYFFSSPNVTFQIMPITGELLITTP